MVNPHGPIINLKFFRVVYDVALNSTELYDPPTGNWTTVGNLNSRRWDHTASLLTNGKVIVIGGADYYSLNDVELYDPSTGSWTYTENLNTRRVYHTATMLSDGRLLVAGGETYGSKDYGGITSAELFKLSSTD